ncbi:MAG: hypothetical protein ABSG56_26165 [Bryobacteraceae bacterium]|jgi:hypothetical protein
MVLARMAKKEGRICERRLPFDEELPLLDRVSALRMRLERSFTTAAHELTVAKGAQGPAPAPLRG